MAVSVNLTITKDYTSGSTCKVTAVLKAKSTSGSYNNNKQSGYITIDGTKYSFTHAFSANTTTTLATASKNIARAHSDKTISVKAAYASGISSGTVTDSASVSIANKPYYSVTYNANGGSGTVSAQTKWYAETLTLRSNSYSRTGYTFSKWNTKAAGGGTSYSAGGSYTANAAATLYAQWTANKYTVTFNANGGTSGSVTSLQRTYNAALSIPDTTTPTRQYYDFLGWSTDSSATAASYTTSFPASTSTSTIPLYAVWKRAYVPPSLDTAQTIPQRTPDEDSTNVYFPIYWTNGYLGESTNVQQVTRVKVQWKESTSSSYSANNFVEFVNIPDGTESITTTVSSSTYSFDTTKSYDILITLTDAIGAQTFNSFVSNASYIWKVKNDGTRFTVGVETFVDNDVNCDDLNCNTVNCNTVNANNLQGSQSSDLTCEGTFGGLTVLTGAKVCTHTSTVGQQTFPVSFGNTTFKYLPNVQLTSRNARGNYIGDLTVAGLTTTGFNISIYSRETAAHDYNISWLAIGELA